MSFLDYLKEHRGDFIDHRVAPPVNLAAIAWDSDELLEVDSTTAAAVGSGRSRRSRRSKAAARGTRFRHVRPAFAPSPYSDPLPYEEPWERAFR